jgi:hypothetical protein
MNTETRRLPIAAVMLGLFLIMLAAWTPTLIRPASTTVLVHRRLL